MGVELTVPQLGESVSEAVVGKWHKKVGEAVSADEPLVVLETDKVTIDVPAPAAGALENISRKEGDRVKVGEVLRNCVGAIRLDAALGGKPVLVGEIEDELCVQADPKRLAQIINNLIANSYKYGDNHSPIRVRASRLGDGFGRIEILNAGPGISLRERGALFEPFGHENGGRLVPGAGLGLSIAKLLAERQGGRIDFESIPGRQTRFWIDLPLAA